MRTRERLGRFFAGGLWRGAVGQRGGLLFFLGRDEGEETVHRECHGKDDAGVQEEKGVMFVDVVFFKPGACHCGYAGYGME